MSANVDTSKSAISRRRKYWLASPNCKYCYLGAPSSKGEVQYHLSEPASIQTALKEPLPNDEILDTDEVFIKDPRQQIYGATQPGQSQVAAPQKPTPDLGNIVVSQAGGQYPGDNAAPQVYQVGGNVLQPPPPQQVGLIRASMAEDRALLFSPFRGTPDEDPAEFWRRLGVQKYRTIRPSKIGDSNACRKCA